MKLHQIAHKLIPKTLYCEESFSQSGEDMVLRGFFEGQSKGFYVDVGAHHPFRFSNTAYFYRQGWSGINIEPDPDSFKPFLKYRKRDINLNVGIDTNEGLRNLYRFDEPALNSFILDFNVKDIIHAPCLALKTVFDRYKPKKIDFLSVDTELYDDIVLRSNDWDLYRPTFVVTEMQVDSFMLRNLYRLEAQTKRSFIYKNMK